MSVNVSNSEEIREISLTRLELYSVVLEVHHLSIKPNKRYKITLHGGSVVAVIDNTTSVKG